jgi:hypothetical protein
MRTNLCSKCQYYFTGLQHNIVFPAYAGIQANNIAFRTYAGIQANNIVFPAYAGVQKN